MIRDRHVETAFGVVEGKKKKLKHRSEDTKWP
jgi:hypothetical protein